MIHTKIVKLDPLNPNEEVLKDAAGVIKNGGLVIIPTETVYGIAADSSNKETIERLYEIKARPKDKPFSLHIDKEEKVRDFSDNIPVSAWKLISRFWPGPLTIILKAKKGGTIGIRMPDNEIALKVINLSQVKVVCPSANLTGHKPPVNFTEAINDLNGLVDFAIDGGQTQLGQESSIVDFSGEGLQILRSGAIKDEDIKVAANKKTVLFICTGNSCRSVMAKALLEAKLKEKNRTDIEVISAGIMMSSGLGASEATKELLRREGIDISAHRSQRITEKMLRKSDIILVMERLQEERVVEFAPDVKNRVFLLKEFAKIDDRDLNIADPIGRTLGFYEETFTIIKQAVERVAEII